MENVAEQNYRMVLTEREVKAARMRKFVSFAAGMAGLLFGLDIGVISGALPFITTSFALTSQQQEWVVSAMMLGAALGAIATGLLSSRFGRKYSLLTGAGLFIFGSLGSALAVSVSMLLIARVILGFAVGVASYTAPLYLSEMADKSVRGKLIAMYQLMVTVGILIAFLSDTALSFSGDWRLMLGIICVPAVALLLAVFGLPDSPRWLASKGRFEDAKRVLTMLSGNDEKAAVQMKDIKESLEVKQEGWGLFKANKNVRRAVFLGMLLQAMQQFTGMNIIMYYAPKIFSLAGFTSTTDQMIATVFDGLMFVLATFIAMDMVDKAGRKPALKIGFSVMAIGTFILGSCLYFIDQGNAATWISYLAVAMTIVCIAGYAMSAAPVVWILCSEIQPLKSRDFGTACSTTTNWVSNMIIGATFLTLLNTIGSAMTFWLYTIMNVIFIFLTIYLLPETKNVSLEQIEKNLMAGKKLKNIGC